MKLVHIPGPVIIWQRSKVWMAIWGRSRAHPLLATTVCGVEGENFILELVRFTLDHLREVRHPRQSPTTITNNAILIGLYISQFGHGLNYDAFT